MDYDILSRVSSQGCDVACDETRKAKEANLFCFAFGSRQR